MVAFYITAWQTWSPSRTRIQKRFILRSQIVQFNTIPVFGAKKKNNGTIWRKIFTEVSVKVVLKRSWSLVGVKGSLSCAQIGLPPIFYWAACAPSHKMGFRSSVSKSGLPGEGGHEGLVPRNDVLTKGFIWVSLARTLARILFVPRLPSPWKTHKALRTCRRLFSLFEAIRSWESLYNFFIVRV